MFKSIALMLLALPAWGFENLTHTPRATFASAAVVTPGTAPTDICVLSGSATKTIRVNQVFMSTTQSTAGINAWFLVKRSARFPVYTTQGVTMSLVPLDLATVSSVASSITLTSNATTLGTSIGNIKAFHLLAPAPAGTSAPPEIIWDFDRDGSGQPIVLRGLTDTIAVNFNGASLPSGLSVACGFTWTEE